MASAVRLASQLGSAVLALCSGCASVQPHPVSVPAVAPVPYTYQTNNGTITITKYTGPGGAVDVPRTINGLPVAVIGDRAFEWNRNVTSATIPHGVTTIDYWAFYGCGSLTNAIIPNSVTDIRGAAFGGSGLTSVTIPASVTNIGGRAFENLENAQAFTVDPGNRSYSSVGGVLFDKTQTTLIQWPSGKAEDYTIPFGVTSIGKMAFWLSDKLTDVTIPASVTSIGVAAFKQCTRLRAVTIPASVTNIGDTAFVNCHSLTAITVDPLNAFYSSVDGILFDKNQTILMHCPARKAGSYAIPSSVTTIDTGAFQYCTGLSSVTIPASVTSIKASGFFAAGLSSVTVPASVTNIGHRAFGNSRTLTSINVDALNSVYSSVDGVLFNKDQTTLIECPGGFVGNFTVPGTVTEIGSMAFWCRRLTGVTFMGDAPKMGGRVIEVNANGFTVYYYSGKTGFTSPTWQRYRVVSVETLGDYTYSTSAAGQAAIIAFNRNYTGELAITNILGEHPVTSIGSSAFKGCASLGSITIPTSVTSFGECAFWGCTGLTNIAIPASVTSFGRDAFQNCTNLRAAVQNLAQRTTAEGPGVSGGGCATTRVPVAQAGDYMVVDLSDGPSALSYPVSYMAGVPVGGWTDDYKTTKMVFRRIPAGTFTMGSPVGELGRERPWPSDETQHQVTLTQPFYIGVFEVTQRQWERVMGTWPSYFTNASCRDSRPVEQVSYNAIRGSNAGANWPAISNVDADSFMGRLRARTGKAFDLPTESQWEYAGRAGKTTALNSGKNLTDSNSCPNMSEVGRYYHNGGSGTAKAGSYLANRWGLYDIHGNVWEWCLDWRGTYLGTVSDDPQGGTQGSGRVLRGGDWFCHACDCRVAQRWTGTPLTFDPTAGFRAALPLGQ